MRGGRHERGPARGLARDPRPATSAGAPDEFNYGTAGGLGRSAFTGASSGAMGGLLADSYAGRGPIGWRRPDASIADDIHHVLTYDDELDPRDVEVRVAAGDVTLTGRVDDRASKRRLEDLVVAVSGVRDVFNHVRVRGRGE